MSSTVFKIEAGTFGLSLVDPAIADVCAATKSQFTDFTCQITSGALTASPNVGSETVPATWCEPEKTIPQVGETSYALDLSYLQDPQIVAGLSRFLFENDAKEAFFFMGLDSNDPPKAIGKVRLVSGAIGGPGRTTLTATVSLPVDGKPAVCFGDVKASAAVGNPTPPDPLNLTATTFGADPVPADLAALKASAKFGDSGSNKPAAPFTQGQYVVLGDGSKASFSTTWAAGAKA
jgi:hypothetical protein